MLTTGCGAAAAPTDDKPGAAGDQPAAAPGTAVAALQKLPVRRAASMASYERDAYGPAWSDDVEAPGGHNACDTTDVVRRGADGFSVVWKSMTSSS